MATDDDDDGVLEAAQAIRPYLRGLVGPAADALDGRIADELNSQADPAATASRLRALLGADEDTAWFLGKVLADAPYYRPPQHQPRYRHRGSLSSPAGDPGPVAADRFACPQGDYVWYRPELGTPVPDCPSHHVALARS